MQKLLLATIVSLSCLYADRYQFQNYGFAYLNSLKFNFFDKQELWATKKIDYHYNHTINGYFAYEHVYNSKNYSFGAYDRSVLVLRASDGFIRTYQAIKRGSLAMPQINKKYHIFLDGEFIRTEGVFYQQNFFLKNTLFFYRINSLYIKEYIDMNMQGYIIDDGQKASYELDVNHNFTYKNLLTNTKRVFWEKFSPSYFKQDDIISHIGSSIDFGIKKRIKEFNIKLIAYNLFSHTKVDYLMNYHAKISSNRKIKEGKYYTIKPTLSAKTTEISKKITLPKIYIASIENKLIDINLIKIDKYIYDNETVGFKHALLSYSYRAKEVGFGLKYNPWRLLISKNYDKRNSNNIGIFISFFKEI